MVTFTHDQDTRGALGPLLTWKQNSMPVQLRGLCRPQVQLFTVPCDFQQVSGFLFAPASLRIKSMGSTGPANHYCYDNLIRASTLGKEACLLHPKQNRTERRQFCYTTLPLAALVTYCSQQDSCLPTTRPEENKDEGPRQNALICSHHLLPVYSWYSKMWHLSFLICKMGLILYLHKQDHDNCDDGESHVFPESRTVPLACVQRRFVEKKSQR